MSLVFFFQSSSSHAFLTYILNTVLQYHPWPQIEWGALANESKTEGGVSPAKYCKLLVLQMIQIEYFWKVFCE